MNQQVVDMLVMAGGVGLLSGTFLGYKLRGLREYVRRHDQEVREINEAPPRYRSPRSTPRDLPAFVSLPAHPQVVKLPVARVENTPLAGVRADVVSALMGAGYKKAAATQAADAVEQRDRATVEQWTVAALRMAASR